MKRAAFVLFLVATALFLATKHVGCPKKSLEPTFGVEKFTADQNDLLDFHNTMRNAKGLKPLEIDELLCDYAQKHADYMESKESLTHSSMGKLQETCGADVVGENIAWGQKTPELVVSSWMWSPMHRWNILGSSYKKVGFGIKEDSQGRKYWCAVFSS